MSGVLVLQNELKGGSDKIALVAFDLLYLNGGDIRNEPLFRRKAELKKIVAGTDVQFSESFDIDPKDMLAHACKVGLEGVVSKVRRHLVLHLHRQKGSGRSFRAARGCMTGAWLRLGSTPDRAAITRGALAGFQWCAETLLTVSVSKSPDAERPTSPRLMMPTIRLLLLITGSLRTCNFSM